MTMFVGSQIFLFFFVNPNSWYIFLGYEAALCSHPIDDLQVNRPPTETPYFLFLLFSYYTPNLVHKNRELDRILFRNKGEFFV